MSRAAGLDAALKDAAEPDIVWAMSPRVAGLVSGMLAMVYAQYLAAPKPGEEEAFKGYCRQAAALSALPLITAAENKAGTDALRSISTKMVEVEAELERWGWQGRLVGRE